MIRLIPQIVGWLRRPLTIAGVDYPQFRLILELKLTLDRRRRTAASGYAAALPGFPNPFLLTLIACAFIGAMTSLVIVMAESALVALSLVYALIIFWVSLTLIADFSAVLLDAKDHQILGPRPVAARTLFAAKLAHVVTYLSSISLSLALGPLLVGTFTIGPSFPIAFLLGLAEADVLAVGFVAVLHLLLMRFLDEDRLRDAILYAQVFAVLAFFAGMYGAPDLVMVERLRTLDVGDASWLWFFPPAWLAAGVDIGAGNGTHWRWALVGLGVGATAIVLLLLWLLAPSFRTTAGAAAGPERRVGERGARSFEQRVARLVTRRGAERAAFEWAWRLCARTRTFKRRVYPMLGLAAIVGVTLASRVSELPIGRGTSLPYMFVLYFVVVLLATLPAETRTAEDAGAAWIYRVVPVAEPGPLLVGALKAVLCRFVVPAFSLAGVLVVAVWGVRTLPDVLLAGAAAVMLTVALSVVLPHRELPFSVEPGPPGGTNLLRMLLVMMAGPVLGAMHGLLTVVPGGVLLAIPVSAGITRRLLRAYHSTDWGGVRLESG